MAENNNPQDFAEKVLQSLKKQSRAVDLSDNNFEETSDKQETVVNQETVEPVPSAEGTWKWVPSETVSQDFTALGSPSGGGLGPASGGNKDLVVVPGYGGTAATSTSQINFYWNAPAVPDSTGVDANVRATIFNYATTATNPVLVIGGYNGTSQFKPHPGYGGGTGVTAKILIDPFLGRIDVDQIGLNSTGVGISTDAGILTYDTTQSRLRVGLSGIAKTVAFTDDIPVTSGFATTARNVDLVSGANNASHFLTFSLTSTGSGVALSSDAELTYNPSTNILTATTFSGALSGTATTAQNVNLAAGANAANHSVVFSLNATGTGVGLSSDAGLQYNPATNVLTADVFSGNFTGTAATATNFFGTFVGNSSTATTASNVNVVAATTAASHFITFSPASSGSGLATSADADLTYNPATNVLSASVFTGNFTGTAVTATNFFGTLTGNVTGNLTGTATTSQNVNTTAATTAGTHFVLFSPVNATASGVAVSSDAQLQFNPGTNVLTADVFSGNFSGAAATATNFYGTLTGNVTGNVTGTATTAQNVNTTSAATASAHFLLFSPVNATASGVAVSSDGTLQFNPGTNVLSTDVFSGNFTGTAATATNFYGTLVGNVTGTATTAQNVNLAAGANNANHAVVFSLNSTGSGVALSSDAALYYNPSTDTLFSTNFSGAFSGTITGIATSARSVDLQEATANSTHYVTFSPLIASPSSNAGVALSSDSSLTFNPSTNVFSLSTGSLTANGIRIGNSANTVDTASGNLTLDSTGGQTNINDNVVIQGNLTVQGTTLTVDSTVSTFVDPVVVLGSGVGGTHSTADNNQDRGIEFRYASSGTAITGFFGFQDSDFKFRFIPNATLSGTNVYSGNVGVVVATLEGNVSGTAVTATNFYGALTGNVTGNLTGTATTAQTLNTVSATTAASHFLLFSPVNGASGVAVSSDAQLTYNPNTDVLSATTFSGALTGTATTAQNINLAAGANNSNHSVVFSLNATGSGVALSSDAQLTYNPSTDLLSATTFSGNVTGTAVTATNFYGTHVGNVTGNVTGTATTATNINTTAATTAGAHFLLFSPVNATASGVAVSSDSTLQFNPGTNVLTTDVFSGNFTGTAATATNFFGTLTGNVTGNVTGTATTAQNVNLTAGANNSNHSVVFSLNATGTGVGLSSDAGLQYNPSTNVLTADVFSGNFTGTAVTATNFFGTFQGSSATAVTSQNINTTTATTAGAHYLLFSPVNATASGVAVSSDSTLQFNPATNVLTTDVFSGNVSGTAVTATNLFGTFNGSLVGTATTAQNVNVVAATTAATHFITFSTASSGSGLAVSADTDLTYNPSTNVLSAGVFSGNFTGTAVTATNFYGTFNGTAGSATTAQNVNVVAAASAGSHFLLLAPAASGSGLAVSSDAQLSYVPTTDTLTVSNIVGSGAGLTLTASAALTNNSYLTIQTVSGDDASTSDFFIRGITSGASSKFSVDANGNLRATTKSFDIDHPTKPGKRLVYGVLEGPEHGVYHRGTVEGKGNLLIELPDYWSKLVNDDYTVTLTTYGNYSVHIIEKSMNSFIIGLNGLMFINKFKNIKVDYIVHGSRIDAPLITEQDDH
jgi:hypothetical protein